MRFHGRRILNWQCIEGSLMKKCLKFRVCRHTPPYTSGSNVWCCRLFMGITPGYGHDTFCKGPVAVRPFDFHTNVRSSITPPVGNEA